MRLRSLWIGNYRNLQDLEINFPQGTRLPVYLAVGVNGTGKSGMLRVLVHIFNALEYNEAPHVPFRLEYERSLSGTDVHTIRIAGDGSGAASGVKFEVIAPDGSVIEQTRGGWASYLPERIIVYTSGSVNEWQSMLEQVGANRERQEFDQTEALHRLQEQSEAEELNSEELSAPYYRLRSDYEPLMREVLPGRILLVSHEKLKLALLATLALEEAEAHAQRSRIYQRANVDRLARFALRLEKLIPPELGREEFGFQQEVKNFVSTHVLDRVRRLAEAAERRVRNPDGSYHLLFEMTSETRSNLATQFYSPIQLYDFLVELQDRGVLAQVDLVLRKTDLSDEILDQHLSDGEYEFLGRMALFMLLNQPEALFLLDEPETHFNDVWKRELVQMLAEILGDQSSTVLLTTHSAIVVSDVAADQLLVFTKDEEGKAHLADFQTPIFGADPSDVMINLFGTGRAGGEYSARILREALDHGTHADLEKLLDEVGPGYWRFRIRDRLESLKNASSDETA
jgi:ABC-type transport system involved in cytochrome c biogenesis ATPase subunit